MAMKNVGFSVGLMFLMAALAVPLVVEVLPVAAQSCDPMTLLPCAGAISSPDALTYESLCCVGLREQQSCFCQYLKDPTVKEYFSPGVAQIFATACNVTIPTNCP